MPLPDVGTRFLGISNCLSNQPLGRDTLCPVRGEKVGRKDAWLSCEVTGQTGAYRYNVSPPGNCVMMTNFLYVGHTRDGVAAGVAVIAEGLHVYSDNFGGCELHVLAQSGGTAGFLHVYRGTNSKVRYVVNPGWDLRAIIPTGGIVPDNMGMSIIAYAYVAKGSKIAQCRVLTLDQNGEVRKVQTHPDWEKVDLS
jgi:hypothetical protein